jgi:hypothetical protein
MSTAQAQTREIVGGIAMIGIVGLFGWLVHSAKRRQIDAA